MKTYEVLKQELFSLFNEKDKLRTPENQAKFMTKLHEKITEVNETLGNAQANKLRNAVEKMLNP